MRRRKRRRRRRWRAKRRRRRKRLVVCSFSSSSVSQSVSPFCQSVTESVWSGVVSVFVRRFSKVPCGIVCAYVSVSACEVCVGVAAFQYIRSCDAIWTCDYRL